MEPVSEAEQLSSTSERWEKVVDTLRVGTWCRAGSLALGVRPEPRPDPEMLGLELALLTRLTAGLSGHGGGRSDSGSGWSMLVVSVLIKDRVSSGVKEREGEE